MAVSDFRVGDSVRWKHHDLWGSEPKVITETGLESPSPARPGEQVMVRIVDGRQARVSASDIELVPGAERGPLSSRGKCPRCGGQVRVRKDGMVGAHKVATPPEIPGGVFSARRCDGSGKAPATGGAR